MININDFFSLRCKGFYGSSLVIEVCRAVDPHDPAAHNNMKNSYFCQKSSMVDPTFCQEHSIKWTKNMFIFVQVQRKQPQECLQTTPTHIHFYAAQKNMFQQLWAKVFARTAHTQFSVFLCNQSLLHTFFHTCAHFLPPNKVVMIISQLVYNLPDHLTCLCLLPSWTLL